MLIFNINFMTTLPTAKSTKSELFAAFEDMRMKYEDLKTQMSESPEKRRPAEDALVQKTMTYTPTSLENEMGELRRHIQKSLDELLLKLAEESKKLEDMRETITIETTRLKEIRNIELAANTLDAMLAEYDQKKKDLEAEILNKQLDFAEEIARRKKEMEREQEEYIYNQKITRRKEEDVYEVECAKKEALWEEKMNKKQKELEWREVEFAGKYEVFTTLQREANEFPTKLEGLARETEERVSNALHKEFDIEKRITEQEWKSEKNILETKISTMQETCARQATEIASLKKAIDIANQHAQTLAATVIESVSGMKQTKVEI